MIHGSFMMQIEGTPRIKTIKVHNAVACLRVKAVGEVIEKLERTSFACQ